MVNLLDSLRSGGPRPALMIDCGVDDFFLEVNRAAHQKLVALGVPHEYVERSGGHSWDYWGNDVRFQLFYFRHYFDVRAAAREAAPPAIMEEVP